MRCLELLGQREWINSKLLMHAVSSCPHNNRLCVCLAADTRASFNTSEPELGILVLLSANFTWNKRLIVHMNISSGVRVHLNLLFMCLPGSCLSPSVYCPHVKVIHFSQTCLWVHSSIIDFNESLEILSLLTQPEVSWSLTDSSRVLLPSSP